ncbi:BON domain-containing protein [Rhizobium sp. PL01]|uniref:BON domain-containing protein n=1 Tax=Rhizobium sp. PL01 TaxID=3085631 RepID=UPI002981A54C|nr:BON domain-containing protein [Rhizobium sp. PL01]MDW5317502.1 BON domain-containing protein [Rhizobium sp. PL01]
MQNDNQLQKAVTEELSWEPSIKAAHIGVTAKNGVVTLSGHVDSYMEKQAAEKAARRVKGVKAVAEEIEVKLAFDAKRTDDEIAAAALNRLEWDVEVPNDIIRIKVEKGWVTLTGEVEWHFQQVAAERDVRALLGVVGVSNQTSIKPRVNEKNISENIRHALHRSWFDAKTINVTAKGGEVHLTGTADSWYDRQLAGSTAWAAPGATGVQNDITIN